MLSGSVALTLALRALLMSKEMEIFFQKLAEINTPTLKNTQKQEHKPESDVLTPSNMTKQA